MVVKRSTNTMQTAEVTQHLHCGFAVWNTVEFTCTQSRSSQTKGHQRAELSDSSFLIYRCSNLDQSSYLDWRLICSKGQRKVVACSYTPKVITSSKLWIPITDRSFELYIIKCCLWLTSYPTLKKTWRGAHPSNGIRTDPAFTILLTAS